VPKGGPDGGDGGRGGNVILRADQHVDNLSNLFYEPLIKAKNGGHGMGKKMSGRSGADKTVKVPVGTVVWRTEKTTPVILSGVEGSRRANSAAPPVMMNLGLDAVIVFWSFRAKSRNPVAQLAGNSAGCLD